MATAIEFGNLNSLYLAQDYTTFRRVYFDSFGRSKVTALLITFDSMGRIRPVPRPG